MNRKFLRGEQGMTLIEIMVVIAIIGIVATLFTMNVMKRMEKAKINAAKAGIKSVEQVLEQYNLDNGEYPGGQEGISALGEGDYFKGNKVPKDPWNQDYIYMSPGPNGEEFVITSKGPDKKEGTDDDISSSD